ncbi:MAG TPA: hypothetical protein VMQ17_18550 [Candidatus Sulfotelmatobacter sp.]|jgi:hypothetical protein|nr:hypothetical protein [Candidatus Sulfotelmatobacter sp.]
MAIASLGLSFMALIPPLGIAALVMGTYRAGKSRPAKAGKRARGLRLRD